MPILLVIKKDGGGKEKTERRGEKWEKEREGKRRREEKVDSCLRNSNTARWPARKRKEKDNGGVRDLSLREKKERGRVKTPTRRGERGRRGKKKKKERT